MKIVLGIAGGIAAYKAVEVLRQLTEAGHQVQVVPTANALRFVGEPTWAALSGQPVHSEVFVDPEQVAHVRLGREADLVLVAPATADLLARASHGAADDLLTNVLLTAHCPVVYAPAMHTEMWEHPATQANVELLRQRGALVLEPAVGRLTGADSGKGRLPAPEQIVETALRVAHRGLVADLAGKRVVVSAGGTREYLDPVRFVGNRSSGRQGYALASTAIARGASVRLVAANTHLADPAGVELIRVTSAEQLHTAIMEAARDADAVVMAAAPADFRPVKRVDHKIKKTIDGSVPVVELAQNPDILADLVAHRESGQVLVGFAAETGDSAIGPLEYARRKLATKGCDLLVVNEVGEGKAFEVTNNSATILSRSGTTVEVPMGPKADLADAVWDAVLRCWATHKQ